VCEDLIPIFKYKAKNTVLCVHHVGHKQSKLLLDNKDTARREDIQRQYSDDGKVKEKMTYYYYGDLYINNDKNKVSSHPPSSI